MRQFFIAPFILLSILHLGAGSLLAQEESALEEVCKTPLSVAEIVDMALSSSYETRSSWWRTRQAAAAVGGAKAALYPQLFAIAGATHGREYKFIEGPEVAYTSGNADLVLTFLLFDSGLTKAEIAVARAALDAAHWQSNWTWQSVMHKAISQAYELIREKELLAARLEALEDAKTSLEDISELFRAGLKRSTDLYAMKAAVAEIEIEIAQQRSLMEIAQSKLAVTIGKDVETCLTLAALPDPKLMEQPPLQQLITLANKERSDLVAKQKDLVQTEAEYFRSQAQNKTKISVNAKSGIKHYLHDHATGVNYSATLAIDVPLFIGYESIYSRSAAYAATQASQAELHQLQQDMAIEIFSSRRRFDAAQQILQLAVTSLHFAQKTYDAVLDKYKAGMQSVFDLTSAQRQLADERMRSVEAKIRWYSALAELAYATGIIRELAHQ